MWTVAKLVLLRWVMARSFGGLLGILLALAVPFAGILKVIGLPLLLVLLVVGAPVIFVLLLLGLPLLFVLAAAGVIVAIVTGVLMIGMVAFKFLLPIFLIALLVRWIVRRRDRGGTTPTAPTTPPPYSGPVSGEPSASTIDPFEM